MQYLDKEVAKRLIDFQERQNLVATQNYAITFTT